MSFNLYLAGPVPKDFDYLIKDHDFVLLSYMNCKSGIKKRHEAGRPTFIDSGAFSAHTRGVKIDTDVYIEFLNTYDSTCSIAAQLDTIPGEYRKPKTKQQLMEAPEKSWENYEYMRARLKSPLKLLPIYHQGEDIKHLKRMLEYEEELPYIGISPANDVMRDQKAKWCDMVWEVIAKSSRPNVKTHAFGMTSLELLEWWPWFSADSATWTLAAAYGKVLIDLRVKGEEYTISTKNPANSVNNLPPILYKELKEYFARHGFDLDAMQVKSKERQRWNIYYLINWARNYKYSPKTTKQNKLF